MPKVFFRIPADEVLESSSAWRKIGSDIFAATQADCVIIQSRDKVIKGPPIKVIDLPGGTEYSIQDKRASVVKHAGEIQPPFNRR
jgi:hypothetical protein